MGTTIHLLDGTYELFRSYFGAPKRPAPDGREVGATVGLIETTLALLRDEEVTHLGVATDHVIESFRNELFSGYKTSAGVPADLLAQFDLAERALEAVGVVVWPMVEFEADDAIATATARWKSEVSQVVILSPDKDFAQVIDDGRVVAYDRRRRRLMDEEAVWTRFGIGPPSIPDYLALVGDSADGIPGLRGWGAKTTSAVLSQYRHLEEIPKEVDRWEVEVRGGQRLASTLSEQWEEALLYRHLATVRTDVPLPEELPDLEWRGVPQDEFLQLCDELGAEGLRSRPHRWR